jgi:hypothetical protein
LVSAAVNIPMGGPHFAITGDMYPRIAGQEAFMNIGFKERGMEVKM